MKSKFIFRQKLLSINVPAKKGDYYRQRLPKELHS